MNRMSIAEYRKIRKPKRKSKYGNKKVEVDGIVFDSMAESIYYTQLKLREKAREILFFRLQPRYLLQEDFEKNGVKHRRIDYVADFEIHHLNGSIEVIDVKGHITETAKLKFKLFNNKYPHKLTLVKYENGRFKEL